jgi:NADPH:quinone reductase-like Zn-dependent oxidoreductase
MADSIATILRGMAEQHVKEGCFRFMSAFDLTCDGSTWEFDAETRKEAEEHLKELIALFREGDIRPKRSYIFSLRAMSARDDQAFQRFLQTAIKGKRVRRKS